MIKPEMIIKKTQVSTKRTGEPVYHMEMNQEYWKSIKEPINVVLDEAHTIMNPRRSMSKVNVIVGDWLSLIRRVLGQAASGYGELVLISQLWNRLDLTARSMCTNVRYHVCHYLKTCQQCQTSWGESSEHPEPMWTCPSCGSVAIKKHGHQVECWHFPTMTAFIGWKEYGLQTFHRHYMIDDIEQYFGLFDTLQWESMLSTMY